MEPVFFGEISFIIREFEFYVKLPPLPAPAGGGKAIM